MKKVAFFVMILGFIASGEWGMASESTKQKSGSTIPDTNILDFATSPEIATQQRNAVEVGREKNEVKGIFSNWKSVSFTSSSQFFEWDGGFLKTTTSVINRLGQIVQRKVTLLTQGGRVVGSETTGTIQTLDAQGNVQEELEIQGDATFSQDGKAPAVSHETLYRVFSGIRLAVVSDLTTTEREWDSNGFATKTHVKGSRLNTDSNNKISTEEVDQEEDIQYLNNSGLVKNRIVTAHRKRENGTNYDVISYQGGIKDAPENMGDLNFALAVLASQESTDTNEGSKKYSENFKQLLLQYSAPIVYTNGETQVVWNISRADEDGDGDYRYAISWSYTFRAQNTRELLTVSPDIVEIGDGDDAPSPLDNALDSGKADKLTIGKPKQDEASNSIVIPIATNLASDDLALKGGQVKITVTQGDHTYTTTASPGTWSDSVDYTVDLDTLKNEYGFNVDNGAILEIKVEILSNSGELVKIGQSSLTIQKLPQPAQPPAGDNPPAAPVNKIDFGAFKENGLQLDVTVAGAVGDGSEKVKILVTRPNGYTDFIEVAIQQPNGNMAVIVPNSLFGDGKNKVVVQVIKVVNDQEQIVKSEEREVEFQRPDNVNPAPPASTRGEMPQPIALLGNVFSQLVSMYNQSSFNALYKINDLRALLPALNTEITSIMNNPALTWEDVHKKIKETALRYADQMIQIGGIATSLGKALKNADYGI